MKHTKILRLFATIALAITSFVTLSSFTTPAKTADDEKVELIKMLVKEIQTELPTDMGDGLVMTAVYTANSNLVLEFTCSDAFVELMRLGLAEMSKEEAMENFFCNEYVMLVAKICAKADYGIRCVYLTKSRKNQVEILFTASDLNYFLYSDYMLYGINFQNTKFTRG